MKIIKDAVTSTEIASILKQHREAMLELSPKESVHAIDINASDSSNITYWSAWIKDEFAGCIALKVIGVDHGEIKSMKTVKAYLRRGVAKALVLHLEKEAKMSGINKLSLETGTNEAFIAAHKLYRSLGYTKSEKFSDYEVDPHSLFMSKTI